MDEDTDDISEIDTMIAAPLGCDACTMGGRTDRGWA